MAKDIRIELVSGEQGTARVDVRPATDLPAMRVFSPDEAARVAEWFAQLAGAGDIVRGDLPPTWHKALARYPLATADQEGRR